MKYLKSHFWYNQSQRNGIFFLLFIIIVLHLVYMFVDFSSEEKLEVDNKELIAFQMQIDSLKAIEIERRKPKTYPFNPNYITDYKGAQLGLSIEEIDRLHAFRKSKKFVNSAKQFQRVTKVSDSLLIIIAPYFKFPDWVTKQQSKELSFLSKKVRIPNKYIITTSDINQASVFDFQSVQGVGEILSERILKYRKRLQGFTFKEQLSEVWKLDPKIAARILIVFKITNPPMIKKINLNTATFKEVLSNPYIDYELCKKIFEFRDEVAELQSIEELKNIGGFPLDKYKRITLYLEAK
ncbi:MAG: helix-hairpin-helix domain-containing protein [Flavobacteriaceae bacterium]|nr:helix-hairpin-helix domain-containing protein [Flavobacteriaceae bacterium]MBL4905165.1 helix-hairpin-helix domain-containing protein [Flavobacteriaceae bacterium]